MSGQFHALAVLPLGNVVLVTGIVGDWMGSSQFGSYGEERESLVCCSHYSLEAMEKKENLLYAAHIIVLMWLVKGFTYRDKGRSGT